MSSGRPSSGSRSGGTRRAAAVSRAIAWADKLAPRLPSSVSATWMLPVSTRASPTASADGRAFRHGDLMGFRVAPDDVDQIGILKHVAAQQDRFGDLDLVVGQGDDQVMGRLVVDRQTLGQSEPDIHFRVPDHLPEDIDDKIALALRQVMPGKVEVADLVGQMRAVPPGCGRAPYRTVWQDAPSYRRRSPYRAPSPLRSSACLEALPPGRARDQWICRTSRRLGAPEIPEISITSGPSSRPFWSAGYKNGAVSPLTSQFPKHADSSLASC